METSREACKDDEGLFPATAAIALPIAYPAGAALKKP
jgi:hypothetical protein